MNVEIVPVWKQLTEGLERELIEFWRDNDAIVDEAQAKRRAMQAVCVVRDGNGVLCGIATAVVRVLPRLRQPMYYYRMFFSPALRGHRQFLPTFLHAKKILQDYNAGLHEPESLGLLLELENGKLGKAYPRAHEPDFGAMFIGYSPRGLQLRVSYFEDAELLPPARVVAAPGRGPSIPDAAVVAD